MSALVDAEIKAAYLRGSIIIDPYDRKSVGTNSYDVHLSKTLKVYDLHDTGGEKRAIGDPRGILDVRRKPTTKDIEIPDAGFVLQPGVLYLASTTEYTESHAHLPILNGKSSIGRLGLSIHVTAGTGDVGFRGHWTMELFVIHPLRVYAGMAIGQLLWFTVNEMPEVPYDLKQSAKYNNRDPLPQASKMHQEQPSAQSEE
jgi:dCTP deaminase